jgi:folate-binding protein YgfZ
MSETASTLPNTLTDAALESYDRLKDDCGMVTLPGHRLIMIEGDDRKGWLQGQVTNNLRMFESGASTAFCICEPTGQILAACDAWAFPNFVIATTATECAPAVLKRVEQMVIVENVEARDVTEDYRWLSIQGPGATKALSGLIDLPKLDAGLTEFEGAEVLAMRSNRTGLGGWDLLIPAARKVAIKKLEKEVPPVSCEAFEIARLEAGIPLWGRDMTAKTLPPELGQHFSSRHINYNKGCYTGQEVLMRIHSRGHTNRTWMALFSEEPLEDGALIEHRTRKDAGVVTSAALSPDYGWIAGAMVRTEAAFAGETVTVHTSAGPVTAEVQPMPITRLD